VIREKREEIREKREERREKREERREKREERREKEVLIRQRQLHMGDASYKQEARDEFTLDIKTGKIGDLMGLSQQL
jgi:hypothetical protein